MGLFKKDEDLNVIRPKNIGWLEKKLSSEEIDYVWNCIKNQRKASMKDKLAGNIHASHQLIDKDDWFFQKTLYPLCLRYAKEFGNQGDGLPIITTHPYFLEKWRVNYQKQNEFNPLHSHTGVYSFVIWMKIPTSHFRQNLNPIALSANSRCISNFEFKYLNILGGIEDYSYELSKNDEGTLVFFPSNLMHNVHPFYNCDKERISVSGNILLQTTNMSVNQRTDLNYF